MTAVKILVYLHNNDISGPNRVEFSLKTEWITLEYIILMQCVGFIVYKIHCSDRNRFVCVFFVARELFV